MKDQKVKIRVYRSSKDLKDKLEKVARTMKLTSSQLAEIWFTKKLQTA